MQTLKKSPPHRSSLAKRSGFWGQNLRIIHPKQSQSDLGRFISADPIGFACGLNLYTYVGNNPTSFSDTSGLNPLSGANARIDAGMRYYGGFDLYSKDPSNFEGDTLRGVGLNPSRRYSNDAKTILAKYKIKDHIPSLKIGDIVDFGSHWGTVVDVKSGKSIVFGQDGNYGVWAGTLDQYSHAQMVVESIYRVPGSGTSNSQVAEYHRLERVMPGGKLFDGRADIGK